MPADVRELLRDAAAPPRRDLDVDALVRRGRRRDRRNATLALLAVGALVVAGLRLPALLEAAPPEIVTDPTPVLTDELRAALDGALAGAGDIWPLPAVSAAVVFPDGTAWTGTVGEGVTDDTVFALGHLSELFTAGIVASLLDDGQLSLDDRLGDFVPDVDVGEATVRDLLYHVSGLPDIAGEVGLSERWTSEPGTALVQQEVLGAVSGPIAAPGTDLTYADTDYLLLAVAATRATGQPPATLLRERVLAPLDLERTYLQSVDPPVPPVARPTLDGIEVDANDPLLPFTSWATLAPPSTGMAGTATDVARFVRALFGGELLEAAGRVGLTEWAQRADPDHLDGVAGLVSYEHDGREVWVADTGGTPGYFTAAAYLPDVGVSIVALATVSTEGLPASRGAGPDPIRALLEAVIAGVHTSDPLS